MRLIIYLFFISSLTALEPRLLNKGKVIYENDFSKKTEIKKPKFWIKQNTRWSVEDGVLTGIAATSEYQEKQRKIGKGHLGDIPRIGFGKMPKSYIMSFRFQIDEKKGNSKTPMFEFGHHVSRIFFSPEGAKLLTDHEKVQQMEIKGFKLAPGKWYEVLGEVGEEDLFIQIKDADGKITVFYCHYPKFKEARNYN